MSVPLPIVMPPRSVVLRKSIWIWWVPRWWSMPMPNALAKDCATHFKQYYLAPDSMEDEAHVASVRMVHDAQHEWVKRFDARAVPTAVIARGKTVLYHGRIDDRNPRLGERACKQVNKICGTRWRAADGHPDAHPYPSGGMFH